MNRLAPHLVCEKNVRGLQIFTRAIQSRHDRAARFGQKLITTITSHQRRMKCSVHHIPRLPALWCQATTSWKLADLGT